MSFEAWISEYLTADRIVMMMFIYNAAVQALPEPEERSPAGYLFVYRFAHGFAANINVVRKSMEKTR